MEIKNFFPGDKVILRTRNKSWQGHILESYDPEIILLKLNSGYNIGIREREIINAKLIEKKTKSDKKEEESKKDDPKLKNIAIIITGGTISSKLDPKTGAVIPTGKQDLLDIAPELKDICNISKVISPFTKLSEDMDPSDWKKISQICEKLLNNSSINGIILTHGTDSLPYTSSALSFFIKNLNKPIALTYSQRSIDRASTDASLNLICAAKYAVSDIAEVAIIGHENTNDETCLAMPATKTKKMHTSRRDTFKIINSNPIARISRKKFEILDEFNARDNSKKAKLDAKYFEKIAIIKIYPGQNPSIIEHYQKQGYKGLIIETTGLGHVPGKKSKNNFLPKIKKAIQKGIFICATPQTINGRLNPNIYSSGRELQKTGILFLEDMLSETALVKLGWVLAHPRWKNKIKEKMLENISRELSKRLEK